MTWQRILHCWRNHNSTRVKRCIHNPHVQTERKSTMCDNNWAISLLLIGKCSVESLFDLTGFLTESVWILEEHSACQ